MKLRNGFLMLFTFLLIINCKTNGNSLDVKISSLSTNISKEDNFSVLVKIKNISNEQQIINELFIHNLEHYLNLYYIDENNSDIIIPGKRK